MIKVDAGIESPTVPYLINADKTVNTSILETKVAGRVTLYPGGFFRDAQSGILNNGPFPPRVGVPTNFTIHWAISNFATDVDNVEVRARLEDGVNFTGNVKGNTDSLPEFDANTREVVWRVGRLLATTGVIGEKPEAVFQIEAIPSQSFIGKYFPLLGNVSVQGADEFTGTQISSTAQAITTRLLGDPTVKEGDGLVIQ